jgi:hypothetical protein
MPTRAQIFGKAREYVGTPFDHQKRVKQLGIDCVGLALCVGHDLGIMGRDGKPILPTDYPAYSSQPAGTLMLTICKQRLAQKKHSEMKPGDVVAMRMPVDPVHLGIVSEIGGVLHLIHAYNTPSNPRCVEHVIDARWRRRIVGVFEYAGVTD